MIYNQVVKFNEWITRKYVEWRGDAIGHERSVTEFADYVGVSQQLMSDWMKPKGKRPRSQVTIGKLVAVFGNEVYEVLDKQPEDENLSKLMALYYSLPDTERKYFVDEVAQLAMKLIGAHRDD